MKLTMLGIALSVFLLLFCYCSSINKSSELPWDEHGALQVKDGSRIIQHQDGTPFLWLGCTAWGMTEWLPREDVDLYLDDRQSKGMNVVQLCLFWGKRVDYPTKFTANPENPYGHKALEETDGLPNPLNPAVVEGGSPTAPNDYWDHVDYCLNAIEQRGMVAAVLPFWGRRYVNTTHTDQSLQVFTDANIKQYGEFLGKRYGDRPNIIWVNGGDVAADTGGDFLPTYRLLAEGLVKGVTGEDVAWDQEHSAWDEVLMTYHPSGAPLRNSSEWFHTDPWLDFNMIETHVSRDQLPAAVRQDVRLTPVKPTVMGEGHYEGTTGYNGKFANAIHIRRQAYQTFFCGAAGHTYGGHFAEDGSGPLFAPTNNWKPLLDMPGAGQMVFLRSFLEEHDWWAWQPADEVIVAGRGEGELEKVAVRFGESLLVYFPENSEAELNWHGAETARWYNSQCGEYVPGKVSGSAQYIPPGGLEDGILILN